MRNTAPRALRMGRVALVVHNLGGVARFYEDAIGLTRLAADDTRVSLGAGDAELLELRHDPAARRHSGREAGLFHTAFLLPTRGDLGRWMKHAANSRLRLQGASDHFVSEAIYLADPEGNGIEVYADRPRTDWRWHDGIVDMATDPLDVEDLAASAGSTVWNGAPAGAAIGHVHLQVGSIAAAEAFYADLLGFDVTRRYPGATFYSAAGYHHHIATNIWNSRGASALGEPTTGLAEVRLIVDVRELAGLRERLAGAPAASADGEGVSVCDPWGTRISFVPG